MCITKKNSKHNFFSIRVRHVSQLERKRSDIIFYNEEQGKQNSAIRMNNIDFECLYKDKDHIFYSLKNENEPFITKISYYELHVISIF